MFTKQKKSSCLAVHPVAGMLIGMLVTVGLGALIVTKRRSISSAARRMADTVDHCCSSGE